MTSRRSDYAGDVIIPDCATLLKSRSLFEAGRKWGWSSRVNVRTRGPNGIMVRSLRSESCIMQRSQNCRGAIFVMADEILKNLLYVVE